jgi:hypothetical protein
MLSDSYMPPKQKLGSTLWNLMLKKLISRIGIIGGSHRVPFERVLKLVLKDQRSGVGMGGGVLSIKVPA